MLPSHTAVIQLWSRRPPWRSLKDFVLGFSRYRLPDVLDLQKWRTQIKKNLYYYQTNYMLLSLDFVFVMCLLSPVETISGVMALTLFIGLFYVCFRWNLDTESKLVAPRLVVGSVICGIVLLHCWRLILKITFLPVSLTLMHAAVRDANLNNMETVGPDTPIDALFQALGIVNH